MTGSFYGITASIEWAFPFQAPLVESSLVEELQVVAYHYAGFAGLIAEFEIDSGDSGEPGTTLTSFDISSITETAQVLTALPSSQVVLAPGTTYWLAGSTPAGQVNWNLDASDIGTRAYRVVSGTSVGDWVAGSHSNVSAYAILGDAVPGPVQAVPAEAGLLVLLLLARSRKRRAGDLGPENGGWGWPARLLALAAALGGLTAARADTISFVVDSPRGPNPGLVRVSSDGSTVTPIGPGFNGNYGIYVEPDGDIVTSSGYGTADAYRVTPSGSVSMIAPPPTGVWWFAVTEDHSGDLILADNNNHAIYRVSPDGSSVTFVANYPVVNVTEEEDVSLLVDSFGNYIVADDNGGTHMYSITPAGVVTPIALSGAATHGASALAFDGAGNYLLGGNGAIYRVTPSGYATVFAQDPTKLCCNLTSIARDPVSGEVLATLNLQHELLAISPDGGTISVLAQGLSYPTAVGVDASGTPEPCTWALLGGGLLGLLALRRGSVQSWGR
jgi:hypothetical protein